MAKKTSKGKSREVLIVASKVKAYIKGKKCMTSADAIEALSDQVYAAIDAAVGRASGNGRKTVKSQDV